MAHSSSDSDDFLRGRIGRRPPLRASLNRARNYGAEEVTEKIHNLASTLQDTNRNLRHVDRLLGQYREYNKEQTEAIATLKETLEQSIGQLRSQRLNRNSGMRSASLSSLYPSDLDGEAVSGNRHFLPTSPLRDYGDSQDSRHRRSRSASVRFVNEADNLDQLHSFHQSLRDLSSEQVRLGDDISRELSRRNRTDAEMRKTLAELSEKLTESQRQETSLSVKPFEREMSLLAILFAGGSDKCIKGGSAAMIDSLLLFASCICWKEILQSISLKYGRVQFLRWKSKQYCYRHKRS